MNLLAAERIKLLSTRSPWWCSGLAIALVVGGAGLIALTVPVSNGPVPPTITGQFLQFGLVVVMVMAAVSVTTEYRFATVRTTFQSVPNRTAALLAKTGVVGLAAGAVGLLAGVGSWVTLLVLRPEPTLALTTDSELRIVLGPALVFAVAGVLAVAVGILLRQTAGAVALLLVWALLLENVVMLIPDVGTQIHGWLPFANAANFLSGSGTVAGSDGPGMPLGPWASLAYMTVVSAVVLAGAIAMADRRDA